MNEEQISQVLQYLDRIASTLEENKGRSRIASEVDSLSRTEFIRVIRTRMNINQEGLATKTGLSRETIRKVEHGIGNPSLLTMMKIANALGVRISELVERE